MTEHGEHVARRLADGWYAVHTCQECKREFNSLGDAILAKTPSLEQAAKLVYDTCCDFFGPGHEEHSILIISKALRSAERQGQIEMLSRCLALMKPQWLHGGIKELQENLSINVLRGEMKKLLPAERQQVTRLDEGKHD